MSSIEAATSDREDPPALLRLLTEIWAPSYVSGEPGVTGSEGEEGVAGNGVGSLSARTRPKLDSLGRIGMIASLVVEDRFPVTLIPRAPERLPMIV